MSVVILTEERLEQLLKDAGEAGGVAGAQAAIERVEANKKLKDETKADRRLRNTKLLLKNYRSFADIAKSAVYTLQSPEAISEEYKALMLPGRYESLTIESIKKNALEAEIMCAHIRAMMKCMEDYCNKFGSKQDRRRWRVTYNLYINTEETRMTVQDIMIAEDLCDESAVFRDFNKFCDMAAGYFFGLSAIADLDMDEGW